MELNREKLKRMFEDTKGNGGSTNGGGGGGALAGYATQAWVNEGFVSIEFFNRLFTVYGPGETSSDPDVVIEPNDLDSTIKNIKAMFGLWTEQYLSALGLNPGGTGSATSLGMLDDVDITTPTNGQALVYNSTSLKWENQTISTVTALANLTDVLLTSPADGQTLLYNSISQQWYNSSLKTINGQSLLGSGDISVGGGASGNYLPLTGGTLVGTLSISIGGGGPLNLYSSTADYTCIAYYPHNGYAWSAGANADGAFYFWNNRNSSIVSYFDSLGTLFTNNTYPTICAKYSGIEKMKVGYYNTGGYSYFSNETNRWEIELFNNGGLAYKQWSTGITLLNLENNGKLTINSSNSSNYVTQFNNSVSHCGLVINAKSGFNPYIQFRAADSGIAELGTAAASYFYIGPPDSANGILNVMISTNRVGINTNSPSYTLHVSGSIYATGAITALSDINQKNIKEYMQLGIDEVANAPVIKFTWKDPKAEDKGLQVGSIAQYWEKVLPEAVKRDKEGTLSMSYGVVALVAAISTAKKVQEHERRITELERENKDLKVRLRRLNRYGEQ